MKKPALVLALLALALSSQARGICVLESPAEPPANGTVLKGLRIHEWGVFLLGGKGVHAGAGGEPPTFIQRVEMPSEPAPEPEPLSVDKPVLHIYAPKPIDLEVRVAFPGGTPKLAWPRGTPVWTGCQEKAPGISWSLKVGGEGEPQPPKVPDGHWIGLTRKVGSDRVCAGNDVERFLFYEGAVGNLQVGVSVDRDGQGCMLSSATVDEAWLLEAGDGSLACLHDGKLITPPGMMRKRGFVPAKGTSKEALRAEFDKVLATAGLSDKESAAVLDIWMPELVKPGKRLVYVLPREEYDRLLPIVFDPMPEELKRVGLVIQEIQP